MARAKAEASHEKVRAGLEGRDRKSREHDNGASGVTVTRETYWAEAETRLMEEIISRANMQKATTGWYLTKERQALTTCLPVTSKDTCKRTGLALKKNC